LRFISTTSFDFSCWLIKYPLFEIGTTPVKVLLAHVSN
jgi:hypothetical protein